MHRRQEEEEFEAGKRRPPSRSPSAAARKDAPHKRTELGGVDVRAMRIFNFAIQVETWKFLEELFELALFSRVRGGGPISVQFDYYVLQLVK